MEQDKMNIQWYPGHMTKTRRQIEADLKLVDAVCEIVDARIPISSRNPDIDAICGNKPRIIVLNRMDLADIEATKAWMQYFRNKGFDVVFMTDPIDEWIIQSMMQFDKKLLKNVAKGEMILKDEERQAEEKLLAEAADKYKDLTEFLQKTLDDKVKEVRFSSRLVESPCCLVGDEHSISPQMERIFRAMKEEIPVSKRIMELNPKHPLIEGLNKLLQANKDDENLRDYAEVLLDQALLAEGTPVSDTLKFSKNIAKLMINAIK